MAKRKRTKSSVPRLNKDQILNISLEEIEKASLQELRTYVRTLADVANKRIKRLEKNELSELSPSYMAIQKGGFLGKGNFSTANKDYSKLLTEFIRASNFIQAESSTIKGVQAQRKRTAQRIGKVSINTEKKIWENYEKYKKNNKAMIYALGSDRVINIISSVTKENPHTNNSLINTIIEDLAQEEYENEMEVDRLKSLDFTRNRRKR